MADARPPSSASLSRERLSSVLSKAQQALEASQASLASRSQAKPQPQAQPPLPERQPSGSAPPSTQEVQPPPPVRVAPGAALERTPAATPRSSAPPTPASDAARAAASALERLKAVNAVVGADKGPDGARGQAAANTNEVLARARALLKARAEARESGGSCAAGAAGPAQQSTPVVPRSPSTRPPPPPSTAARGETPPPPPPPLVGAATAAVDRDARSAQPSPVPPLSPGPQRQRQTQPPSPVPSSPTTRAPSPLTVPLESANAMAWSSRHTSRAATPEAGSLSRPASALLALPPPQPELADEVPEQRDGGDAGDAGDTNKAFVLVTQPARKPLGARRRDEQPAADSTTARHETRESSSADAAAGALVPVPAAAELAVTSRPRRAVRDGPPVLYPPEVLAQNSKAARREYRAGEKRFEKVKEEIAQAKAKAPGEGVFLVGGPGESVTRWDGGGPVEVALNIATNGSHAPATHVPAPLMDASGLASTHAAPGQLDVAPATAATAAMATRPLVSTAAVGKPHRAAAAALPTVPATLAALLQPGSGKEGSRALFVSNTLLMQTLVEGTKGGGKKPPAVTVLDVTACRGVSPKSLLAVAAAHPELERLWASGGQKWTPEQVVQLLRSSPGIKEVELDLRCTAVTPQLLQLVGNHDIVRVRSFTHRGLIRDPSVAIKLAEALHTNESLTTVELKGRIHSEGMPYVLQAVAEHPRLASVTLEAVGMGPLEATYLAHRLAGAPPHLLSLNVRGNRLGDAGVIALADEWLLGDARLVTLDLSRTLCSHDACIALTNALAHAGSVIRTLILAGNSLGTGEAQQALGTLILRSTCLDTLDCSYCSFVADNMKAFFRALASEGCNLRQLLLRGNPRLSNDGAAGFAEVLRANTSLRSLDLGDCRLTSNAAVELATAARGNTSLESLALEYNNLGETGMRALEASRSATLSLFL